VIPPRYTPQTPLPPEGWVSSREAARMWGCTPTQLRRWMQEAGISPVRGRKTERQGHSFFWDPAEVLAVRAIHAKRKGNAAMPKGRPVTQKERRYAAAHTRGRIAVFKEQRLEWLRQYYLGKARKRQQGDSR